jgi:hypothetical protein
MLILLINPFLNPMIPKFPQLLTKTVEISTPSIYGSKVSNTSTLYFTMDLLSPLHKQGF